MRHFVAALLLTAAALGQRGTYINANPTWNGLPRQVVGYRPPVTEAAPALVVVLHGTTVGSAAPLNIIHNMGWEQLADANGFLVKAPMATYKAIAGSYWGGAYFWQSYGADGYFLAAPDDSGFVRSVILAALRDEDVDPARVFVMGFSSGGMMAHRVAIDSADLVAAAAPLSGTAWIGNSQVNLPLPSQPVSVLLMHGDADPTIPYCGGWFNGWGEGKLKVPSVDDDLAYWLAADGLPLAMPLCVNGVPTSFRAQVRGAAEVQFVRELGFGHTYKQGTVAQVWEFFASHGR